VKIQFTRTLNSLTPENKKVVGTAELNSGQLVCTGQGEKYIDAILHGNRDPREIQIALTKAKNIFNTSYLKAEEVT
jgi:hypothetical protein